MRRLDLVINGKEMSFTANKKEMLRLVGKQVKEINALCVTKNLFLVKKVKWENIVQMLAKVKTTETKLLKNTTRKMAQIILIIC